MRWYREGQLSSIGRCFDIGLTTGAALRRFEPTGEAFLGDTDRNTAKNGSLMRLAPAALAYWHDPERAIQLSAVGAELLASPSRVVPG